MKTFYVFIFILTFLITPSSISLAEANEAMHKVKAMFPESGKGYEIYAFEKYGKLYFTLITGTNRRKNFQEIDNDENIRGENGWVRIKVEGIDKVKILLQFIPPSPGLYVCCPIGSSSVDQATIPLGISCPPSGICDGLMEIFREMNKNPQ